MLWLALAAPAWAGHWTVAGGPAFAGGAVPGGSYTTIAPFVAGNYGWRFFIVETWLGGSASMLRGSDGEAEHPAAPLQAEWGLGLGARVVSGGFYLSAGFSGGGGGLYAQVTLPAPGPIERWGVEARTLSYRGANASGLAILFRVEPGAKARAPRPDEEGVHHEDPYAAGPTTEAVNP